LKVKRLIKLLDSSPSKMVKDKKTRTSAGAAATKSAAALAHMAEKLGREEAAANDQVAPAANASSMGMVAAAVCDLFVPGANNRDSVLAASRGGTQAEKVQQPPALGRQLGIFKPQREVPRPLRCGKHPPSGARPPWPSPPS
jgi:hypothetical protein